MVLGNAEQVFYIPRIEPSLGFGVGFGRRFRSGLWSVSYLVSGHDVTFQGRERHGRVAFVPVQLAHFLTENLTGTGIYPFWPQFSLVAGTTTMPLTRVGKFSMPTYLGVGVNAGAGLLFPLSSRMFFSGSLIYRFIGYLYAKGPGRGIDVTDLFDDRTGPRHRLFLRAPVLALELSLGYTFYRRRSRVS